MSDLNVAIRLRLDGQTGVVKGVEDVAGGFTKMRRSARDAVADVAHLGGALLVFNQLKAPIADAVRALDAFGAAASRIDLVTRSAAQSAAAQAQLFAAAQASRVQYTELAEVYARLAKASAGLGVSQARMLAVTQSISQAMTIGGGSAESMRAALMQLGQGLASGTLRGEELNSILEQTPRLAQAIAEGMGVGVGELRKLGEQGRLTAQQVIGALEKEAPKLAAEFARVAPTLGSAFTVLKDGAARAFVEFDKGAGASRAVAEAMLSMGKSMGSAAAAAREFGESYGGALKAVAEVGAWLVAAAAAQRLAGWVAALANYAKHPIVIGVTLAVAGFEGGKALAGSQGFLGWQLRGAEKDLAELAALRARGMRAGEEALFDGLERRIAQARARVDSLKRELATATDKARQDSPEFKAEARRFANAGSFRAQEIADLNEAAGAGAPFPGAKPLSEVREYVKTALSIQEEWQTKAVALAEAYANAIAKADGAPQAEALARQRDIELTALADKARKEMEGLDKDAGAVLKARLDGQLALEKSASAARLDLIKAAHAAGLLDEEQYTKDVLAETQARLLEQYALQEKQYAAGNAVEREQALARMRETAIELARAEALADAERAAAAAKARAARSAAAADWVLDAAKEAEAAKKTNEQLREQIDTLGLAAREVAEYKARKLDAAAASAEFAARELEDAAALLDAQRVLPEVADGYRRLAAAKREAAGEAAAGAGLTRALGERQASEEFKREWEKNWNEVDRMAREAFADFVHGGRDAAKRIGDAVKTALLNAVYEATLRPLVFQVYANVAGAFGLPGAAAGMAGAGGGLGGIGNLLSTGNSLSNAITGGGFFGGFSAGAASVASELALGSAFVGPSATLASGSVGLGASLAAGTGSAAGASAVAGLGSALPWIGLGLGALALFGGDLFGGKQKPPVLSMTQFAPGSAPWGIPLATPWGELRFAGKHMGDTEAAVAQIRDSLAPLAQRDYAISALLTEQENEAVAGRIAGMGTGATKDYSEAALRSFFSRRLGGVSDAIGGWVDEIADTFAGSLEDQYTMIAQILSVRHLPGAEAIATALLDSVADSTQTVTRQVTREVPADPIIADEYGTAVKQFTTVTESVTETVHVMVSAFQREGETLADAYLRIVRDYTVVSDAFEMLGRGALELGVQTANMSSDLVKAAGGVEAFRNSVSAYYQEFYSEEERRARQAELVGREFEKLGLAMPDSHAAFRGLMDGLDLATEAGQNLFASLLNIAPAFDAVADAAEAAEAAARRQQQAYTSAVADWSQAYGRGDWAEALRRQVALEQAPDDQRDLLASTYHFRDQQEKRDLEIQLMEAQGDIAGATAARREIELNNTFEALRPLKQAIWAAQDLARAQEEQARAAEAAAASARQAAEEQARAAEQIRQAWQRVADGILAEIRRLRGDLLGGGMRGFAAAQSEFSLATAAARAGDQEAATRLPELARAVAELGKGVAASAADNALITARTMASLAGTLDSLKRFGIEVPRFAAGGAHLGGLRIVGEHGPELEATGAARIYSFDQMRGLLRGDDLSAEVRALREELRLLREANTAENRAIAAATGRTARLIERVTPDGDAIATRVAA